ncbi:SDR family NAD(P)-dependent oxidoreductase [Maritimibacter sp. HL-12]|uniref:SDR family NAD(P)-dependent oxidoreductase n=1 Tax=Maritimibacter sp. HL-12 TaxID=1162418 RepID=UPI000A0F1963|nr:SDR family NAD(P)-dependent oxidoreductase [Maritimibacter sp. HL-12]SMH39382.1 2-deoxy-D-gluconate 3-dehydrogenase [Maritimibacter sp. HL-12]
MKTTGIHIDLAGQTALVTGASRGIGREIALTLARAGANIIAVGRNIEAKDNGLGAEIRELGKEFHAVDCDLADRSQIRALISRLAAEGRKVDILVNNAGVIRRARAVDHADADWDDVMAVNLDAPFLLARELGRQMVERKHGKIIFVASVLSFQGGIQVPGYAASKGAIAQLTRALANEWAPFGVNVNAVAPGYVDTANTAALKADESRSAALMARVPAGRWGTPQDIVGPVLFLASGLADFVHGAVLPVDGGWLAR